MKTIRRPNRLALFACIAAVASSAAISFANPPDNQGGGNNGNNGNNGGGGPTPTPLPKLPIQCQISQAPEGIAFDAIKADLNVSDADKYFADNFGTVDLGSGMQSVLAANRFPDRVVLKALCRIDSSQPAAAGLTSVSITPKFDYGSSTDKRCDQGNGGICREYPKVYSTSPVALSPVTWTQVGRAIFRNRDSNSKSLANNSLIVSATATDFSPSDTFNNPPSLAIDASIDASGAGLGCRIYTSGAATAGDSITCPATGTCNPPTTEVQPSDLVLSVQPTGVLAAQGTPQSVKWSGASGGSFSTTDAVGLTAKWVAPLANQTSKITAKLTMKGGATVSCAMNLKVLDVPYHITLRKYGNCMNFTETRKYYLLTPDNKGVQGPFTTAVTIPSMPAQYGKDKAEVPFRGIMNAATSLTGALVVGAGGAVSLPPVNNRNFTNAVIAMKKYDYAIGAATGASAYYGVVGRNNGSGNDFDYSDVSMNKITGAADLKDDDYVVFQVFLAKSEMSNATASAKDLRGQSNGTPLWAFAPTMEIKGDKTVPHDYLVPLMSDSCFPIQQFGMPPRKDKALPDTLTTGANTMCAFSKPFKFADLKSGRVFLNVLDMVPEHSQHEYPTNLMRASTNPPCKAQPGESVRSCWNIKAGLPPSTGNADPFTSDAQCEKTIVTYGSATSCWSDQYSTHCSTSTYPIVTKVLQGNCQVMEGDECGKSLAIRFNGYTQMMGAALGCVNKYDSPTNPLSGIPVAATLQGFGDIPYTSSIGGSTPAKYDSYPVARNPKKEGYGCVPCRFGKDQDLIATTGRMTVDQTASPGTSRVPVFSFTKSLAPGSCVTDTTFEIRYFGSDACTGTNNPPGHFCTSGNIGNTVCGAGGDGGGSGNLAGKFTVPLCPGSGFDFDHVGVSLSPILIDVNGGGINISRDVKLAVPFDMKGNGKKIRVDWPTNVTEVAFLVMPDKKGQVTSIKQLFGDYKAKNGFESLKRLDSNHDGVVDARDRDFSKLRLWFDRNRDGVAQEDELVQLPESGIEALPTSYEKSKLSGIEGQRLHSLYMNTASKRYQNFEDVFFHLYE